MEHKPWGCLTFNTWGDLINTNGDLFDLEIATVPATKVSTILGRGSFDDLVTVCLVDGQKLVAKCSHADAMAVLGEALEGAAEIQRG